MRNYPDWLNAFCDYASHGEAPRKMHYWVGVSTIAGALRRHVWISQGYYKWYPNFYVILVAPPGIVAKSTTASLGMRLLRRVPGVKFGPDIVTWQALITALKECSEMVKIGEDYYPMSALTIESSEFGNLINTADKQMMDAYVSLWDCKDGALDKRTKKSGDDLVPNPSLNIVACTTPAWLAGSFPEYSITGGFTSRCVFVYADKKAKYVAYPGLHVPADLDQIELRLVQDLEHIAINVKGEFTISPEAIEWGEQWYIDHYENVPENMTDERFGGYRSRKQTHTHKLAMVIAASKRDERVITLEDLQTAVDMVTDLEADMHKVFAKVGRSELSLQAEKLKAYIQTRRSVSYREAYRYVHAFFPSSKDFEDVLDGLIRSGMVRVSAANGVDATLTFIDVQASSGNVEPLLEASQDLSRRLLGVKK